MDDQIPFTRREFSKFSLVSAAAAGAALASQVLRGSANSLWASDGNDPANSRRKSNIRIGVRFSEAWLHSKNDDDLRFFKQIGVDHVDIELALIKGYRERGVFTKADLQSFISRLDAVGLQIERANALGPVMLNAHLGRPDGQKEIDNHKRIGELLAEAQIPVYGIQACQATQHVAGGRAGWSQEVGRGGYGYPTFSIDRAKANAPKPDYVVTADQLWNGLLNIYRQIMPVVEGSKTMIAMHGNDPPLYEHLGSPQIICRYADFDRLFKEVPSKHNGITFCVGTRYESGEDVFEGIRRFGRAGKLFHVHFRNVRGTLPSRGGYSEVFVDDGDLNMAKVLRALVEADYAGAIDYDHPMHVTGDGPLPKQYISFAVGYMRALLQSAES